MALLGVGGLLGFCSGLHLSIIIIIFGGMDL